MTVCDFCRCELSEAMNFSYSHDTVSNRTLDYELCESCFRDLHKAVAALIKDKKEDAMILLKRRLLSS